MRASSLFMAAALAVLAGAIGARALALQAPAVPAPAADPAAVDVGACQTCHGVNGVSRSPRVPNLAGQQAEYLAAQLQAFRGGTRTSSIMQAIAGQLSDDQITALARYWNSRPAAPADPHAGSAAGPAIPSRMTFPADFPTGFTLYQTVTNERTINERYANDIAIAAARAGRPLPDGSMIVSVNRAAQTGAINSYSGMESRAGWGVAIPALLRNGNWDYASFDTRRARNDQASQAQCLACHRPQEANSFVFSLPALRERAARPSG